MHDNVKQYTLCVWHIVLYKRLKFQFHLTIQNISKACVSCELIHDSYFLHGSPQEIFIWLLVKELNIISFYE